MPNSMKDYSTAKHSTRTVTPDCESVNPSNLFNQLNLLPKQTEIRQESGEGNASSMSGNATTQQPENNQQLEDVESSVVVGNDANGSNIEVSPQTNHVQENCGVTGITGTGHTINIYQCPQELINLLVKSINKKL